MTLSDVIDSTIDLAKDFGTIIPGLASGAAIAEKVMAIFDDLHEHADVSQQAQMQSERVVLLEAVTAKAQRESAALRG